MAVETSFQPYRPLILFRKYPVSMSIGAAMVCLAAVACVALLSDSRRLHDELVWLPLTSWSLDHGDLRVTHFVGLHALQILPAVGMVVSRRRRLTQGERVRWIAWAGGSYAVLFGLLLLVALLGQPLVCPPAICGLGGWLGLTLAGCLVLAASQWQRLRRPRRARRSRR